MEDEQQQPGAMEMSPSQLIDLLNEDLARECQALIICMVHSQMIDGAAAYRNISKGLQQHAQEELQHALILGDQIHAVGGVPEIKPGLVTVPDNTEQLLRFELENGNETIRNYRERVLQCEALGEHPMAERLSEMLVYEQQHHIELATTLGNRTLDMTIA
jgi:bacterioferritin